MSKDKSEEHPPLPIGRNHWRSRWLVLPSWNRLHRISEVEWDDVEDMTSGEGVAVCGAKGWFSMPGVGSRLALQRCKHFCRLLGIPEGGGAPLNDHIDA